ncbi:citrate:proton symporter, partial [Streptomyces sp. S6]
MLAALGFGTIGCFLLLTTTRRVSVLVALVLLPPAAALAGGHAGDIGPMALKGLGQVAPTGIMIAFAVLYFSLMTDSGLFEPLIRGILRTAQGDPVRIAVGTAVLTICVALDGDGASTFLITVSALLPVYRRLGMSRLLLAGVVCLGAGVMNLVPWGGPTARAAASLKLDTSDIVVPLLPALGAGIGWVLCAAYLLGRRERRRLAKLEPGERAGVLEPVGDGPGTPRVTAARGLTLFNLALTVALLVLLVLETMPLPVLFVLAFAAALLVNRPRWEDQQALLERHSKSVVLVTCMIFAAGVFTGVLGGTGMIGAMAEATAGVVPDELGGHLPVLIAVTSMPLSLVFT